MKKSWFKEHFIELLTLSFIFFTYWLFRIILLKEVKATSEIEISIVECVKGALFLVLGFWFGSSIGSKNKEKQLANDKNTEQEENKNP